MNGFKESLCYFMRIRGVKQKDVAARLHCERQTVSNYMRGVSEPDIDTLIRLVWILGVDVNELTGFFYLKKGEKKA